MAKTEYGISKAKPSFPSIDLLRVPHKGKTLILAYPSFGPNSYSKNREEMQKIYTHSAEFPQLSFNPATTSESISGISYDFKNEGKPKILDPTWLQLGYIVRISEGAFANPPRDAEGNPITDEKSLKSLLNGVNKINGIYLLSNDFGFAPYETFKQGEQDSEEFAQSGLARLLEHTSEKEAKNLKEIFSPEFYRNGVDVSGFNEVKEPILRVAALRSGWYLSTDRFDVLGDFRVGDYYGCAFGVLISEANKK